MFDTVYQQAGFGTSEGDSLSAPEGESFFVVTTDEATARAVAPLLARELRPTVRFGKVLHAEPVTERVSGFEVVVEVLSAAPVISRVQNNR